MLWRKKKEKVLINIRDYGTGMSEEELNRLFIIDKKVSKAGTSGEKGSGLGLLLTKELIELNQGSLLVESQPGMGCTFTIILNS